MPHEKIDRNVMLYTDYISNPLLSYAAVAKLYGITKQRAFFITKRIKESYGEQT